MSGPTTCVCVEQGCKAEVVRSPWCWEHWKEPAVQADPALCLEHLALARGGREMRADLLSRRWAVGDRLIEALRDWLEAHRAVDDATCECSGSRALHDERCPMREPICELSNRILELREAAEKEGL
jgi:hypothetical protein